MAHLKEILFLQLNAIFTIKHIQTSVTLTLLHVRAHTHTERGMAWGECGKEIRLKQGLMSTETSEDTTNLFRMNISGIESRGWVVISCIVLLFFDSGRCPLPFVNHCELGVGCCYPRCLGFHKEGKKYILMLMFYCILSIGIIFLNL